MADYTFWLDQSSGNLHQRLETTLQVGRLRFFQGDAPHINIYLKRQGAEANTGFDPVSFPEGGVLRMGLVNPDRLPTGGTFVLGFGSDATPALDYSVDGQALQTALNALASIEQAGGVTVTGPARGPWRIKFNNEGERELLGSSGSNLIPASEVQIHEEGDGEPTSRSIQYLRLRQAPIAEQTQWEDIPQSEVVVTVAQAGGTGLNEIQRIVINPFPRSGTFTLSFDGETTQPIAHNATVESLRTALEALPNIQPGRVVVSRQASGIYLVEFTGDMGGTAQPTMVGNSGGLLSYEGRTGRLSLQRPAVQAYLDNNANAQGVASAFFEIEIQDDESNPSTYRFACDVINDGLSTAVSTGDPVRRAWTTEEADERFLKKTSVVDDLDSTATDKPLSANQGRVLDEGKADADLGNVNPATGRAQLEAESTSQLNARDTANRNRANHTGEQPISSVTNLQSELNQLDGGLTALAESALPRRITASMVSAVKTVVETPAQTFAGASALASRRSLILRNESTSTRIRYGRQSANLQRDGEIIEPQAVVALQLEPGTATTIFACSEGAAVRMHITEDIG